MNSISTLPLAAGNESWILAHDVLGIIVLGVLLLFGVFFAKRQREWLSPVQSHGEVAGTARKIGKLQLWSLYFLVVAVSIFFFFIYPRTTSLEAQPDAGENKVEQTSP